MRTIAEAPEAAYLAAVTTSMTAAADDAAAMRRTGNRSRPVVRVGRWAASLVWTAGLVTQW